MRPILTRSLVTLALLAGLAAPVLAHTASRSFSVWTVEGASLTGVISTDARRVTQLPAASPAEAGDFPAVLAAHVRDTVSARQAGAPCDRPVVSPLPGLAPGDVRVEARIRCPRPISAAPVSLAVGVFRAVSPSHVHYLRADIAADAPLDTALTAARPSVELTAGHTLTSFVGFVLSGAEHVLGGLDHIAFLLALTLLAGRARGAAFAATGFTLGHSITLALTALGLAQPHEAAIEALIGFTIAFAAAEALRARIGADLRLSLTGAALTALTPFAARLLGGEPPGALVYLGAALFVLGAGALRPVEIERSTPLLAALFGLIHGAGFAGALAALELPRDRLVGALLGFNIGVELGQLVALAGFGLVFLVARRSPAVWRARIGAGAACGLFGLGVFWFVARSL